MSALLKRKLRKGDSVLVIQGRERGKSGKVTRVLPDKGKIIVERLNLQVELYEAHITASRVSVVAGQTQAIRSTFDLMPRQSEHNHSPEQPSDPVPPADDPANSADAPADRQTPAASSLWRAAMKRMRRR